ncbi:MULTISPECIES: reverse transcriptase-like protein [unclassified Enterococcus]|uniref:reverse transcriptase-like protein n=1 Tax=unclassified Enterococcus TaxID=2608891 RepID=UPI0015518716|nr:MULTISPECIES: reverse transcriptase-like protein [unclassified Enterococcus]MBS7576162.1 reverse transcriptase-like protein [Enterococcus sp. MMGLQ5-2]MBS7583395.1 reverse transcriptase-like protein [Enterococcus sp. MMGLQ5-1]NPD11255.1 reverse transcriptase-like protein [Enterococcus sp. MMGLQ5-1]NPD35998.1 reverse transcriptase-like protein [Enterococcus sp. MMGLQ5-2]
MLKIYIDAATDTIQAAGGLLIVENGAQIQKQYCLTATENHAAEFEMLLIAMNWLLEHHKQNEIIFIYTDSKAVALAVEKNYSKNNNLTEALATFNLLITEFKMLMLQWLPEAKNKGADTLAKKKLSQLKQKNKKAKK